MNSGPHTQYCRTWCRSWASKLPSTRRADTTTKPIVIATRPARSISHVSPLGVRSKRMRPARTDGRWNVRSPARRPSSVFGDVQMNPSQTRTDCTVARSAPTILVPVMADRSSGAALDVPTLAIELGSRFADAGHELFLVGGSVRDLLLGRDVSDLDFATSAHPTETTKVLHRWADRRYFAGVRFGTVGALKVGPAARGVAGIRTIRDRLEIVAVERMQAEIDKLLVAEHPAKGLSLLVDTGLADLFLPELPALQLEQDPVHQHKDVLRHTYAVVERCEPDLVLRLAGLLHDIGKPKTRQISPDGVSFHHHEVVGARMARERLAALRYPNAIADDVATLIELHLRFHGDGEGWT